jgi:hypothetical protein
MLFGSVWLFIIDGAKAPSKASWTRRSAPALRSFPNKMTVTKISQPYAGAEASL